MSDVFGTIKSLLMDNVRLTLMSNVGKQTSGTNAVLLCIAVSIVSLLWEHIFDGNKSFRNLKYTLYSTFFRKHSIRIEGKQTTAISLYNTKHVNVICMFSDYFKAILDHVLQHMHQMKDVYDLRELTMQNIYSGKLDHPSEDIMAGINGDDKNTLSVLQSTPFLIDRERQIYCGMGEVSESQQEPKINSRMVRYTIHLFSYVSDVSAIKDFMNEVRTRYLQRIEESRRGKLYVYSLTKCISDRDEDHCDCWQESPHDSAKTFKNIFFDGKEGVLQKIDFFLNNRKWYDQFGIPYTLGIGLCGPPGTGKTSFIKALASYTRRHIVVLSLKIIKTKTHLNQFFHELKYSENNKESIGFDKKIIVIEDIDCAGKVVLQRKSASPSNVDPGDSKTTSGSDSDSFKTEILTEVKQMLKSHGKSKSSIDDDDDDMHSGFKPTIMNPYDNDMLTLDDILNLWDGVRENAGRIMVISSNFYDKLDSALVRPGRIDVTLRLDNATRETIREMYAHYYGHEIDLDDLAKIPDKAFSPAEIVNIYVSNHTDPRGFIARLTAGFP
jgi:hypothetical protein